jgi:hypothetical protein
MQGVPIRLGKILSSEYFDHLKGNVLLATWHTSVPRAGSHKKPFSTNFASIVDRSNAKAASETTRKERIFVCSEIVQDETITKIQSLNSGGNK